MVLLRIAILVVVGMIGVVCANGNVAFVSYDTYKAKRTDGDQFAECKAVTYHGMNFKREVVTGQMHDLGGSSVANGGFAISAEHDDATGAYTTQMGRWGIVSWYGEEAQNDTDLMVAKACASGKTS